MEPGRGGQEKPSGPILPYRFGQVAMEPGRGGQEKLRCSGAPSAGICRRNGAWPWRPGKGAGVEHQKAGAEVSQWSLALAARKRQPSQAPRSTNASSQWSLALAARKRLTPPKPVLPSKPVAMEPGLGGQEKAQLGTQGVLYLRVAMEPGLGGQEKVQGWRFLASSTRRRNGAWPWRPGKGVAFETEPSQVDESQWSLALAARKRTYNPATESGTLRSQWSLALAARKRIFTTITILRQKGVAMEPGLGGQEKDATLTVNDTASLVAMEPGLGGQEKELVVLQHLLRDLVAMEPGLGGQEKEGVDDPPTRFGIGRNGAWPWRPGKGHSRRDSRD